MFSLKPILRVLFALLFLAAVACTEKEKVVLITSNSTDFYQNVSERPELAEKASAVVLISTRQGGSGTGFFVSDDGVLVTNEHVVGTSNCVVEGCYFSIATNYQLGDSNGKSYSVFGKPLYVDPVADISVFQIYHVVRVVRSIPSRPGMTLEVPQKTNNKFTPPSFLKLSSKKPESLVGQQVTTIGHPLGMLKKVSDLSILSTNGQDLIYAGAFISGQSGSPVLDQHGEVIGVGKTATVRFTRLSQKSLNSMGHIASIKELDGYLKQSGNKLQVNTSRASASLAIMVSINSRELVEKWHENFSYYLAGGGFPDFMVARGIEPLYGELRQLCETEIKNMEDGEVKALEKRSFQMRLQSCHRINYLVRCSSGKANWDAVFCPEPDELEKIADLHLRIFELTHAMTGQFSWLSLKSVAAYNKAIDFVTLAKEKLKKHQPALSYGLGVQLLVLAKKDNNMSPTYGGKDLVAYFKNYRQDPNYIYHVMVIIRGLKELSFTFDYAVDHVTEAKALMTDPRVSVGDQMSIERSLYQQGYLN